MYRQFILRKHSYLCFCILTQRNELIRLFIACLKVAVSSNEMVAFLCNRPSMFKTSAGWVKDDSTDCLKNPEDILNYCRKVPPYTIFIFLDSDLHITRGVYSYLSMPPSRPTSWKILGIGDFY